MYVDSDSLSLLLRLPAQASCYCAIRSAAPILPLYSHMDTEAYEVGSDVGIGVDPLVVENEEFHACKGDLLMHVQGLRGDCSSDTPSPPGATSEETTFASC